MGCPVLGLDNRPGMICMDRGHRAGENNVTPAVTLPGGLPAWTCFTPLTLKLLCFTRKKVQVLIYQPQIAPSGLMRIFLRSDKSPYFKKTQPSFSETSCLIFRLPPLRPPPQ